MAWPMGRAWSNAEGQRGSVLGFLQPHGEAWGGGASHSPERPGSTPCAGGAVFFHSGVTGSLALTKEGQSPWSH